MKKHKHSPNYNIPIHITVASSPVACSLVACSPIACYASCLFTACPFTSCLFSPVGRSRSCLLRRLLVHLLLPHRLPVHLLPADCDAGDVDDGQKLDALECRPHLLDKECRPSNSMIGSADRQMRRFGVRNSTTLRAARLIQWFGGQSVPEA